MHKKTSFLLSALAIVILVPALTVNGFNWGFIKKKTKAVEKKVGKITPLKKEADKIRGKVQSKMDIVPRAQKIKKNLEDDVKILWDDALMLYKSKAELIALKDHIAKELKKIEEKLKKTQADIETTKKHVAEIEELIQDLKK